jgi:Flp pilus assembly protein TadD
MKSASRFGNALSTIAIVTVLSGCAVDQQGRQSFASKADSSDLGLALRAQSSLASGQYAAAVDFAERAVANKPDDADLRSLLGNCYFASGRFASAETAYRDSLTLLPAQPKLVLKLALVEIAQGKDADALAELNAARNALDPSDYGLAVALAGQPADAIEVLNQAARVPGADSRVRQNLALAYGLSGDWTMARTVAAQDVPPEQLDSRIQQWMAMATPSRPSDQVAALTGVQPSVDPGQPQRLALKSTPDSERYAELMVPKQPQPQPQQQAQIPAVAPPALPDPQPQQPASVAEAAPLPPVDAPAPVVAEAARSLLQPAPRPDVEEPAAKPEAPVVHAVAPKPVPDLPTRFDAPPQPAAFVAISDTVRQAAKRVRSTGHSNSVVQLGAYSSPQRVTVAWNQITKRYPALAGYTPMRARFDGPKGTVWRLSIKGFASRDEASGRCELLQNRGGKCFVRTVAGDAPVQLASR